MPITYAQPTINARLNAVVTAMGSSATMVITDSGNNALVSITLNNPAGTVSGGVLTFTVPVAGVVSFNGTAAFANISVSSGLIISGLTVSSFSGDIIIAVPTISIGQSVTLTSGSITGR